MWKLTSKTGKIHYLLPEKEKHIVGRTNADLILNDDTSISRIHAYLLLCEDHVKLIDAGSKYGTYYNENIDNKIRMDKNIPIELKNGERLRFGVLKNEWILSKMHLITLTSTLNIDQKRQLKEILNSLNGKVIESFAPNCTHLTMRGITVTTKLLYALVERIPIVNCQYWIDYLIALRNNISPPNPENYLPEIVEEYIKFGKDLLKPNEARKTLFAGKTFIFISKKQYDTYMSIIPQAGGVIKTLRQGAPKSFFTQSNVIVIQYVPSTQSQISEKIDDIADYLQSKSIRMIPDYEIGLALVYCSIDKYCNPKFNVMHEICSTRKSNNITKLEIIAEETPINQQTNSYEYTSTVEIPESNSNVYQNPGSNIYELSTETAQVNQTEKFIKNNSKLKNNIVDNDFENDGFNNEMKNSDFILSVESSEEKIIINLPKKDQKNLITTNNQNEKRKLDNINNDKKSYKRIRTDKTIESTENINEKSTTINLSGFLNSSKIIKEASKDLVMKNKSLESDITKIKKRGRFAAITSDDDDDLFDFGKSLKKAKSDDIKSKSNDEIDNFNKKHQDQSNNTAINININKSVISRTTIPLMTRKSDEIQCNVKKIYKIVPGEWLSKSLIKLQIKNEDESSDKTDASINASRSEWINSIKGAFEVRPKHMNLTIHTNPNRSLDSTSSSSIEVPMIKNFKAFVKKRNYIPQREIVKTVPFQIHGFSF